MIKSPMRWTKPFDLSTLGFTSHELATALAAGGTIGLTDENEVPELAEEGVTRAGDIWCLGPHRLACGDSTDGATVTELLGGKMRLSGYLAVAAGK